MIDPLVSLAFAVYSNKGAYALLLGSGISRASGIPTGWEVVLDLVRKVARLQGEDCEPDPADWFRRKHGAEPDYSKLLDGIAKTPAERQQLLLGYFEPTEDERSQGLKLPSAAHKAIAQLVASGYLRVIVTTNFDRLMEKALEEVGVAPTVISTADQVLGALPLAHSGATVIKIHGDYLDTRIRNTESELGSYENSFDRMLDRVFDDFGLIVSGWSGDWDRALRDALERCSTRRFSTFWTARSDLSERAKKLSMHRQAVVLQIKDANHFFELLHQKVRALEDVAAPHPLSAKMAGATVKRYIVDPAARIRLRDLVHEETERLFGIINAPAFNRKVYPFDRYHTEQEMAAYLTKYVEKYDALCATMVTVLVVGCYWSYRDVTKVWVASLARIANLDKFGDRWAEGWEVRYYPTLLLLYSAGLAAVAAGNNATLAAVLMMPKVRGHKEADHPICMMASVMSKPGWRGGDMMLTIEGNLTHVSYYILYKLRDPLREFLPDDEDYQDVFYRFEYLLELVYCDLWGREYVYPFPIYPFAPRKIWPNQKARISEKVKEKISAEIKSEGANWPLLKEGLFLGSLDRLLGAINSVDSKRARDD